jgi:hypothetical protein
MNRLQQLCFGALLAGFAGTSNAQSAPLIHLFNQARGFEVAAVNRVCADRSLTPRIEELHQRFAAAIDHLISVYGEERLRSIAIPVLAPQFPCTDPGAARLAVEGFAAALANLEAALQNVSGERG